MPTGHQRREREIAELAALADGSLAPERRAEVEARVAASPRLQALLREQQAALETIRALDQRAPQAVRSAIADADGPRRRGRRHVVAGAIAAAAAATALVLAALPGSEPEAPTLAQAAALAARAPTRAALPGGDAAWGLAYPDLEQLGWRDAGARVDRVGDRDARTVYYHDDGRRIAYTILASGPVRVPEGARSWRRQGNRWYAFEHDGRTVVAWERHGHMCVVSANGLGGRPLVRLISR